MNWDKKAFLEAWDLADSEFYAREPEQLFTDGAQWQRDQLRTDEAIERIAAQMFTATQSAYEYWDRTDWDELHKSNQDVYRSDARAAITALLGGSDNE